MVRDIQELLVLPPLAVGRLGSSPVPMDNYEFVADAGTPGAYRRLAPAETFVVDAATGEIRDVALPGAVRFRDDQGRIRPVAPFFEVWARFAGGDGFEPLTHSELDGAGDPPPALLWRVQLANHKAFRRTGDANDRIEADTGLFDDHAIRPLSGVAGNFVAGASIPLGNVQYIRPTDAHPEIRLRFTPPAGRVYGCANAGTPADPLVAASVYDGSRGRWGRYVEDESLGTVTEPPGMYAMTDNADPKLVVGRGYLDDTSDGLIEAQLTLPHKTLTARARLVVAPPDFAPDSLHVRVAADDLEQALFGPKAGPGVSGTDIADLVRRGLETLRLMNTEQLNLIHMMDQNGQPSLSAFSDPSEAGYAHSLEAHLGVLRALDGLDAPPGSAAQRAALSMLRRILGYARTYDQVGNFTGAGRRLMPPLMRGSDFRMLALTRRQRSRIERALLDHGASAKS